MLNSEYKVLKYIKNHGPVTKKKIRDRFPKYDIDEKILPNLHPYISIDNFEETMQNGEYVGYQITDDSTYSANRSGEELIEKKQHEFWGFFFPYAITTLIAVSSVIVQIIELFT